MVFSRIFEGKKSFTRYIGIWNEVRKVARRLRFERIKRFGDKDFEKSTGVGVERICYHVPFYLFIYLFIGKR